jgi:hypothetical protein
MTEAEIVERFQSAEERAVRAHLVQACAKSRVIPQQPTLAGASSREGRVDLVET